jgi:hypothetical protein
MKKREAPVKLIIDAVFGVGLVVLFVYLVFDWARHETIRCDRVTGRPRCTVEVKGLTSSTTTVYDDLVGVRMIEHETRRGGFWYELGLKDSAGEEHAVADSIEPEDAKRVENWFVNREKKVEVARQGYGDGLLILLLFNAAAIIFMAWVTVSEYRDWRNPEKSFEV